MPVDVGRLTPAMQRKAFTVIAMLERRGFKPRIVSAYRTELEQRELVRQRRSLTMKSYHRRGLAVDIVDRRYGWEMPDARAFFLELAGAGMSLGLSSGILWGLPPKTRKKLEDALRSWPDAIEWQGPIGWDPAHLELRAAP